MPSSHLAPPPIVPRDIIDIFMSACDTGELTVLRQKITAYPGIVNLRDEDGVPAMHRAVSWAQTEAVELLLENGADPLIKDMQGQTPDTLAARLGYEPIARVIGQASHRLKREEMTKGLKCFKEGLDAPVKAKPVARFCRRR